MSKDPALLFYTSDFLTGTVLLSHEQVGIYIRLICILHQHGGSINLPAFEAFIGHHVILKDKFIIMDGHVMHKRVSEEMDKRAKKSTSMSDNAKVRWDKCKGNAIASNLHSGLHMLIEDVNANESDPKNTTKPINTSKPKKIITYVRDNPPTVDDIAVYCIERNNGINPQAFFDSNTAIGWVDKNKNLYRDWKAVVRKWENFRQASTPTTTIVPVKRPVAIVVVERIASGQTDRDILHDLVGKYTEFEINEALGHARTNVK